MNSDIEVVTWPEQATRLAELREATIPRIILVEGAGLPLVTPDPFEDWIRVPADTADLELRIDTLRRRIEASDEVRPEMDDAGLVRFGTEWVALPPVEARIVSVLVDNWGQVVSREELAAHGWPNESVSGRNALDVHITRIRKRISGSGLAVRTVRSKGYLLEAG